MVSMRHETFVDLFRNRPSLAAELLVKALHVPVPTYTEARIASIDLTETQPAEYRADVVALLLDDMGTPIRVNIIEVQLQRADDKRFTWPAYLTVSRDRHRCPADLLVIAPNRAVADWCAQPIELGVPGFVLRPPVLGMEMVPVVTDPAEAARNPELALLSAMAHGETEQSTAIVEATLAAIKPLDEKRAKLYYDLLYNSVNEAARRVLEEMMKNYVYTSPFAVKYIAQGRDEGRVEEAARAVLTALRVRGITVPDAMRERILAEKSPERLERWHERAILAASINEVLDEAS